MSRKALVVGINYYEHDKHLNGCVNDALSVEKVLSRHEDGKLNFGCKKLTATGPDAQVTRSVLRDQIRELFSDDHEVALLYFAGHGYAETTGGYLMASDASRGDEGVSLTDVLVRANESPAKNKIILLDSCYSGVAGAAPTQPDVASLAAGVTVLTASTSEQTAKERNGHGVFTNLLVDALEGGAADLAGHITPGSIYAHIDQSLGTWEQRPVFKTNVKEFVSLRDVTPPIPLAELRRICEFFPQVGHEYPLNPSFEPEMRGRLPGMADPILENTEVFAILQRYNRMRLLIPVGVDHMWSAAMESKACKLTPLGEHYRRLAANGRI
ncbi:MAG: caspase family protein [Pseudomonadota bacterium]